MDEVVWNYENKKPFDVLDKAKHLGLITHVWTFKDEKPLFDEKTNIVFICFIIGCLYNCPE